MRPRRAGRQGRPRVRDGPEYGGGCWCDDGVFAGKRAMVSLTTGGGPGMYSGDGLNGDLDMILYPINHGIFRFTGFDVVPPFVAWSPARVDAADRERYLAAYLERLLAIADTEPIAYPSLDDYDPKTMMLKRQGSE